MKNLNEIIWRIEDAEISTERLNRIYPDIKPFLESYDKTDDPIESFYYYGIWNIEVLLMDLEDDIENNADRTEIKEKLDDISEHINILSMINRDIYDELIDKNYHHEARILRNEPLNINSQMNWIRNEIC